MDFKGITELIKAMSDSEITNLEIQENGMTVKLEKNNNKVVYKESIANTDYVNNNEERKLERALSTHKDVNENKEMSNDNEDNIYIVKSPIVGTFYAASGPEKEPYVTIGSKVKKGDTLCIIEAMKLMNEVQSEIDGEVIDICAKDGDMMEYEQQIFKIKIDK